MHCLRTCSIVVKYRGVHPGTGAALGQTAAARFKGMVLCGHRRGESFKDPLRAFKDPLRAFQDPFRTL